ncbi:hypothetical protein BDQ94DRAFT_133477 [Aspergillus welwitschiae]|uniref:Uncharacterized protein n=1 Tax=Aspergillus welwitschiae TaxID=1341132 RepID=A0A3F3QL94_9EURO|nr:hypothetical protein BDQ94DRAFT_133477 [Aspergillus welwitschiae]RDH39672.1 hypothetical protein BDQ94DRAFT_133477 [Aspergillus welwitschiae]
MEQMAINESYHDYEKPNDGRLLPQSLIDGNLPPRSSLATVFSLPNVGYSVKR